MFYFQCSIWEGVQGFSKGILSSIVCLDNSAPPEFYVLPRLRNLALWSLPLCNAIGLGFESYNKIKL